jgi:hypothetical protein
MTFVAGDAALQWGTAAFRPIVPVADHNWASQKAESAAEEC